MKQKAELNPLRLGAEGDFGKFKLPDFLTKKKPATIDPFQIEHDRKRAALKPCIAQFYLK